MSTTTVYSLETFVKDLRQAFADHDDLVGRANAVAGVLEYLLRTGGWVQELLDTGGYEALPGSTYLDDQYGHPAPGFHITCGAQNPGQRNTPHDHGAGWVVYGTFQGAIEQTKWGWDYSDGLLKPRLVERGSFVQDAGQAAYFLPGEIHDTRNAADQSVVVRVESQKTSTLWRHRYDPVGNTAKAFLGNG